MGRAQGLALILVSIALVGHLTLGGRARQLAQSVIGTDDVDEASDAKPTPSSSTTRSATRPATSSRPLRLPGQVAV